MKLGRTAFASLVTAAIGMGLLVQPSPTSAVETVYGDANCSGSVDSVDALVVLQYSANLTRSLSCWKDADVDGDGQARSLDAALILQFQARLIERLGPPPGTVAAAAVAAGVVHTCALTTAGGVKCWGENIYGALGDGTTTSHVWPNDVPALSTGVVAITAGLDHTCALTTAGGVKCWGWNDEGELGDGTTLTRSSPVDVVGLMSGVVAIAAGQTHTCAIMDTGGLRCWGGGLYGALGAATSQTCTQFNFPCSSFPVDVTGLDSGVAAIALGDRHTCALTTAGGVKCWGHNQVGQLADGTTTDRSTPVEVTGLTTGVRAITAGSQHTCAVTTAGAVKCWGWNAYAQLGSQTSETCAVGPVQSDPCSTSPVDVPDLSSGAAALGAGYDHTCALTTSGGVKCWGVDGNGVLGAHANETCANNVPCSTTPINVTDLDRSVVAIAAGGYHTCAIVGGGDLKCWGENNSGELGAKGLDNCGLYPCSYTPVEVVGFGAGPSP